MGVLLGWFGPHERCKEAINTDEPLVKKLRFDSVKFERFQ